ncbi:CinA family protein [Pantoea rodasii]|uniref:CinA family protein n=1 Tax=Pantoea rodasii TaxID=1076549 RepID=UPI000690056E|nr:CinA family protein [Pantoea rodasii]
MDNELIGAATILGELAVSEAAVIEMAYGAKALSGDSIGMAVSGYAGPDGGDDGTPAGTVWFGWCLADDSVCTCQKSFSGSSEDVVRKAAVFSINELTRILSE